MGMATNFYSAMKAIITVLSGAMACMVGLLFLPLVLLAVVVGIVSWLSAIIANMFRR